MIRLQTRICAIRAINRYTFRPRSVEASTATRLTGICLLFVGEMQIFAHGPEFAAEFLEHAENLSPIEAPRAGDHFGDKQTREDAVFLGNVAADGEPGAFLATEGGFCPRG